MPNIWLRLAVWRSESGITTSCRDHNTDVTVGWVVLESPGDAERGDGFRRRFWKAGEDGSARAELTDDGFSRFAGLRANQRTINGTVTVD